MSCNYADGLSPYENKGKLGLPEVKDPLEVVEEKVKLLADWITEAKHVVFHTGAGISCAAGIPDFRGPNGVWTLERKGEKPTINTSFDEAEPTKTHMALKLLIEKGFAKFIITQNIDGLHLKSGVRRTDIAELHGNMFVAKCAFCEKFTVLSRAGKTVGERPLGLDCPYKKPGGRTCRGKLHDTLLDWEANLPPKELETADLNSTLADLSICLGTTLQIVPAGLLPLKAKKNPGGKLVIVNLQPTKQDKKSDLIIHSYVDNVMERLLELLGISPIPLYSAENDPTRLLLHKYEAQESTVIDWTIPDSSIKHLRNEVRRLPKKETSKRPNKRPRTVIERKGEDDEQQVKMQTVTCSVLPSAPIKTVHQPTEPDACTKAVSSKQQFQIQIQINHDQILDSQEETEVIENKNSIPTENKPSLEPLLLEEPKNLDSKLTEGPLVDCSSVAKTEPTSLP